MAAKGEEVQLLDEWQHLSSSSSSSSYPPSPKWHDSLLIHNNYVLQEESVFHPSLHENLDHVPLPKPPMFSSSSFVDSSSDDVQQQLVVVPLDNKSKEDGFRVVYLRSCSLIGAVGAIYRVVCNWSFLGWGAWALVSALATAGIVAVAVMSWAYAKFRKLKCLRLKRSRVKEESAVMENLVLLVKQKEEVRIIVSCLFPS